MNWQKMSNSVVDILDRVTNVSETAAPRRKPTYSNAIISTGQLWHTCSLSEEAFLFPFFSSELSCFLSSLFFPRGSSHFPLFQSWSSRSTFPVLPWCSCVFEVDFFYPSLKLLVMFHKWPWSNQEKCSHSFCLSIYQTL